MWARLEDLGRKWLRPDERSKEKVVDEVILEVFLRYSLLK